MQNGFKEDLVKQDEFVRLILQALNDLGFKKSASTLEQESHVLFEIPTVATFRQAILSGDWIMADSTLSSLQIQTQENLVNVKYLIAKQKYLELLEKGNLQEALHCLRTEITPCSPDPKSIFQLSSLIMCSQASELQQKAHWDGAQGNSRNALLSELRNFIPSTLLVPEHRLKTLLFQAIEHQRSSCLYHDMDDDFSLFHDHRCLPSRIPRKLAKILNGHTDEVWHIEYSHSGKYLASSSKDSTAIVWDIVAGNPLITLNGHTQGVTSLSWSPDDKHILTCGLDSLVKLWNPSTGECLNTWNHHASSVSVCCWFPDGKRFVTAGNDRIIYLVDLQNSTATPKWNSIRANDLIISNDGSFMVAVCSERKIRIYNLVDDSVEIIQENDPIMSLCLSKDSTHLLVSLSHPSLEIHIWNLKTRQLSHKYTGYFQQKYMLRACFGGGNQSFVVSGSEDSQIYIWHRFHGELLEVISGHGGPVNTVCWNPSGVGQFASSSDDKTIRLWEVSENDEDINSSSSSSSQSVSASSSPLHPSFPLNNNTKPADSQTSSTSSSSSSSPSSRGPPSNFRNRQSLHNSAGTWSWRSHLHYPPRS